MNSKYAFHFVKVQLILVADANFVPRQQKRCKMDSLLTKALTARFDYLLLSKDSEIACIMKNAEHNGFLPKSSFFYKYAIYFVEKLQGKTHEGQSSMSTQHRWK